MCGSLYRVDPDSWPWASKYNNQNLLVCACQNKWHDDIESDKKRSIEMSLTWIHFSCCLTDAKPAQNRTSIKKSSTLCHVAAKPVHANILLETVLYIVDLLTSFILFAGKHPDMRNLYLSTNSENVCLIGYPARRIRIVSIIPEYRNWRQQSSRSNIYGKLCHCTPDRGRKTRIAFTMGLLYSFGLMHRTKKGLQLPKVAIKASRLFLNWFAKVVILFL